MGIDYSPVGGMGFLVEQHLIDKALEKGIITEREIDYDLGEAIGSICEYLGACSYAAAGGYDQTPEYYILVDGKNLKEITWNSHTVFEKLSELMEENYNAQTDLLPVADLHIY